MFKMSRLRRLRRTVIVGLLFFTFLLLILSRTVENLMSCDEQFVMPEAELDPENLSVTVDGPVRKYTIMPSGKKIRKFSPYLKVKSFADISKVCHYVDNRMQCPDVRDKGETVLRQSQLVTIRMLKIFDSICRKLGLRYWLWRGTLLGAIRHKGVIPWDNDLDIAMLKEDYDKFVSHGQKDLPTDIFLQNSHSDFQYAVAKKACAAKLRDQNSCYGRCIRVGCTFHDGLMIDIFVFEEKDNTLEDPYQTSITLHNDDVFPLKEVEFEGALYYAPAKSEDLMSRTYGSNFMELLPPRESCPPSGMIGIPWYSCAELSNMEKVKQISIVYDSLITKSLLLGWYFS